MQTTQTPSVLHRQMDINSDMTYCLFAINPYTINEMDSGIGSTNPLNISPLFAMELFTRDAMRPGGIRQELSQHLNTTSDGLIRVQPLGRSDRCSRTTQNNT